MFSPELHLKLSGVFVYISCKHFGEGNFGCKDFIRFSGLGGL